MNRSRLFLCLLVLLLALPPGILSTYDAGDAPLPVASGSAAPEHLEPDETLPDLNARKPGNRKDRRREDRKADRKERRERKQRGLNSEQVRIEGEVEAAPPRIPALAEEDDPCGPGLIQLRKSGHCTHGPDKPPPPGETAPYTPARTSSAARRAAAALDCGDDGESGFRIQVLYIRPTSAPDNYAVKLADIRTEVEGANEIMRDSSIAAGEEMRFTFVRNADCEIDVDNVAVSPAALRTFDSSITAIEQQGYDRIDRIYLMFADVSPSIYCGIGTLWWDDRDSPANYNNRGPSYSRVDPQCWEGFTAAHELMHNLGGVQNSAPHTSGYGHCIDEYDVMCYSDAPGVQMQFVCNEALPSRYDCNSDDYFDPLPDSSSYLATHWNTADNWFLTQAYPAGPDNTPPNFNWLAPVGNNQIHSAGSGIVPLQAQADDASGVAYVDFWLFDELRGIWLSLGQDQDAPYTSSVNVSDLRFGYNYLIADAFDTQGNWDEQEIWIQRTGGGVSLAASRGSVKVKQRVTLTATVANPPAGASTVEFRFCRGSSCTWETGQSLGVFTGTTSSTTWKASGKGRVTFLAMDTSTGGTAISNPATISVKKAKKKR